MTFGFCCQSYQYHECHNTVITNKLVIQKWTPAWSVVIHHLVEISLLLLQLWSNENIHSHWTLHSIWHLYLKEMQSNGCLQARWPLGCSANTTIHPSLVCHHLSSLLSTHILIERWQLADKLLCFDPKPSQSHCFENHLCHKSDDETDI